MRFSCASLLLSAAAFLATPVASLAPPLEHGRIANCQDSSLLEAVSSNNDNHDSTSDRRTMLKQSVATLFGTASLLGASPAAFAGQGDYAKIEMPNVMQGMADRVNKQCLMESLGNRECLVYADDGAKLYQGANGQVLLGRVNAAIQAFENVPGLVESKKWSQVSGVMTGPMGELVRNMLLLSDLSENGTQAKKMVQVVKTDLYGISAAVERKDGATALKFHQAATKDLVTFVKTL